jgi:hypothetical protein
MISFTTVPRVVRPDLLPRLWLKTRAFQAGLKVSARIQVAVCTHLHKIRAPVLICLKNVQKWNRTLLRQGSAQPLEMIGDILYHYQNKNGPGR